MTSDTHDQQRPSGHETTLPEPSHPVWTIADSFPPTEWGEQAWVAYQRDLPQLVQAFRGKWAAYHGDLLIGTASNPIDLFDECLRRGFALRECVICHIDEILGVEIGGLGMCRIDYVD